MARFATRESIKKYKRDLSYERPLGNLFFHRKSNNKKLHSMMFSSQTERLFLLFFSSGAKIYAADLKSFL